MTPLALVLLGLVAAAPCGPSRCMCAADDTDDAAAIVAAFGEVDAVFLGRVVATQRIYLPGDADETFGDWREVTLVIERRWKGSPDRRVRVRTPWHPALCGFPFEPRASYLVYARIAEDGRLQTDACMRTRTRDRADADILHLDQLIGSSLRPLTLDVSRSGPGGLAEGRHSLIN